jgi:hypothetical protein
LAKLILMSIVLFTVAFPIGVARRPRPRATVRLIQILTVVVAFAWAYACLTWYPQLVPVE